MRRFLLVLMSAVLLGNGSFCGAQILHKKKKVDKSTADTNTAEPDKVLYDRALDDVKRGKHEVGRLGLQTLINTYPDSEYLAKAKLAIADSYYKEGGSSNITQAIAGYKDFIVFFPFLPEAAYAQMQVAMCNFNAMPKADRDITHTRAAEEEFQTFLSKYPKDPLAPQAQQRLREVQEVLAEGQYRIAYYYYTKGDKRAAAGRLIPLVRRYPLFSQTDTALWMLGDIFEKSERKDIATGYYAMIVRNYPLSKYDADAKAKLVAFGAPVPQADPKSMAWMQAQQNAPRPAESIMHRGMGLLHNGPDVHSAAISGAPQMEAENDTLTGSDILSNGTRSGTAKSTGTNSIVGVVTPGGTTPAAGAGGAAEDVSSSGTSETPATTNVPSDAPAPAESTPATAQGAGTDPSPTAPAAPATADGGTTTDTPASATATDSGATTSQPASDTGNQKESSSKKKGIKKLIPW